MQIIDAHCHYGPGEGFSGPWDTSASLEKYLQWAQEAGIDKTIVFPAFHTDYQKANRWLAKRVPKHQGKLFAFAFIHPKRDKNRVKLMLDEVVRKYGFVGIKVHRYDGVISREICEAAKWYRIPVLYDVMGDVHTVELIAREYPSVNFIIPHLGSFADNWKDQLNFIPILIRHHNVYTDTSGVRRFELLEMAVKEAGAHKVIFGSDGPWLHPGVELAKIYALKLLPLAERQILGGNILKLITKNQKPYARAQTRTYL